MNIFVNVVGMIHHIYLHHTIVHGVTIRVRIAESVS